MHEIIIIKGVFIVTKENKEVLLEEVAVKVEAKDKAVKDLSKNIKKLTLADLKKEGKKLDETAEFFVTIGETEYKLTHDVYFRKTKQREVLEDMLEFFNSIGEGNIEDLEMASPYTALLIIKHFTSLDVSDDISEALALLGILIDLNVLAEIVNALPEGEVLKIYELLTETVNNIKSNIEEAELEVQELSDEVENDIILAVEQDKEKENDVEEVVDNGITATDNE